MEQIRQSKLLGPALVWMEEHPRLTAWIALSIGMVAILFYEARDVGLLPGQWLALVTATIAVAGISIWIVSWDEEDEESEAHQPVGDAGEEQAEPTDEAPQESTSHEEEQKD